MSAPVDVLAVLEFVSSDLAIAQEAFDAGNKMRGLDKAAIRVNEVRAAIAELIADANRWRAVTAVYAGFQDRRGKMSAYISTPQWVGDWEDFNDAIDRQFEINGAAQQADGGAL